MTWRVQEVMNGWLLVFLFKMCCHQALQGPCYRQLVVILTLLKQDKLFFSILHFLPFDFVVGILEYWSVS